MITDVIIFVIFYMTEFILFIKDYLIFINCDIIDIYYIFIIILF